METKKDACGCALTLETCRYRKSPLEPLFFPFLISFPDSKFSGEEHCGARTSIESGWKVRGCGTRYLRHDDSKYSFVHEV